VYAPAELLCGGVVTAGGMSGRDLRAALTAGVVALVSGACVKTSKVDDTVNPARLAAAQKAVAVMRLGSASPNCLHVAILLGTPEGEGYRRHKPVSVANVRSLAETQVAEVELDPGTYHVIGYSCIGEKGPAIVADKASEAQLYRTSYAQFALAPGEIVNVGYFHFGASKDGRSTFGRAIRTDVEISDWPLAEIERFRKLRPAIYEQMKTRLMTTGAPVTASGQNATCETWRGLQAAGKVQSLPPECGGAAPEKKIIRGNR
jgi:hypothetical protein